MSGWLITVLLLPVIQFCASLGLTTLVLLNNSGFNKYSCGWFEVCSTLGVGRGGLKVKIVLLGLLQGEDLEAKAWKLLPWANVLNHTHVFPQRFFSVHVLCDSWKALNVPRLALCCMYRKEA